MRKFITLSLMTSFLMFFYNSDSAFAWWFGKDSSKDDAVKVLESVLDEEERALIEEYFNKKLDKGEEESEEKRSKGKSGELPPGLAKKERLPPGLAKQLEKNGTLPPGLAKRDLPKDLNKRLPPSEKGTKRVIVDDDVVLIEKGTELILDVLNDVVVGNE